MRFIEKVKDRLNQKYFEKHKDSYTISSFENKYSNCECFIIGNGPSLSVHDLELIKEKGYVSFASNKIYNIFDKTEWRPTYVTVSDSQFIRNAKILQNIASIKPQMLFVRSQFAKDVKDCECNICPINADASPKLLDNPKFSMNCKDIIYDIGTVTYFSVQIAAYMGFKKIFLLGMDNRYAYSRLRDGTIVKNEGVVNYFGEQGLALPSPKMAVSTWEMDIAYEFAEAYSKEHDFRIYNATRGGFLEKFERVNFDDVIKK